MNKQEYKILNNKAKQYRKSLVINEIKKEFLNNALLNQNKKLSKGTLLNFGLELTPFTFSQITKDNNCTKAKSCALQCIAFTGIDNMMKSKSLELSNTLKKRIRRDHLLKNDKYFFIEKLKSELSLINLTYNKTAVRLNTISDLDWEELIDMKQYKNIIFYDYTKHKEYLKQTTKHFTYSASESDSDSDLIALLNKGFNIAMVFNKKLPIQWNYFKVINGDIDDNRYKDEKGVIVGLVQKTAIGGKINTKFTTRGVK